MQHFGWMLTTQNGAPRRRHCNATEDGATDAVLLRYLGTELELAEAALPLPAPPRLPGLLANVPRALRTPSTGMATVDAKTIAPRRAA